MKNHKFQIISAAIALLVIVIVMRYRGGIFNPGMKTAESELSSYSCVLIVSCKDVAGKKPHIPKNGIITEERVGIKDNQNAFDILSERARIKKIHLDFKKSESGVYIKGINNIYEKDFGENSGWLFKVNGKLAQTDASGYKVKNNDTIEFYYTSDYNKEF